MLINLKKCRHLLISFSSGKTVVKIKGGISVCRSAESAGKRFIASIIPLRQKKCLPLTKLGLMLQKCFKASSPVVDPIKI